MGCGTSAEDVAAGLCNINTAVQYADEVQTMTSVYTVLEGSNFNTFTTSVFDLDPVLAAVSTL